MSATYTIALPQPRAARGADPAFCFHAQSPQLYAFQLQQALRDVTWFKHWRDVQANPKAVDPSLAATDPKAEVSGRFDDPRILLAIHTTLPCKVLTHRMSLLAGHHWELHDVQMQ